MCIFISNEKVPSFPHLRIKGNIRRKHGSNGLKNWNSNATFEMRHYDSKMTVETEREAEAEADEETEAETETQIGT